MNTPAPLDPETFSTLSFNGEEVTTPDPITPPSDHIDLDTSMVQETIRWWSQVSVREKLDRNYRRFCRERGLMCGTEFSRAVNHVAAQQGMAERRRREAMGEEGL